jgi:hypothetical protein
VQNESLITFLSGDTMVCKVARQKAANVFQQRLLRADLEFEEFERRFVFQKATDRFGAAGHVAGLSVTADRVKEYTLRGR